MILDYKLKYTDPILRWSIKPFHSVQGWSDEFDLYIHSTNQTKLSI